MIALDMGPGIISRKIKNTGYGGVITLEPMNWDYAHLNMQDFLGWLMKEPENLNK